MTTKSIFDCESFDAPTQSARELVSYDDDLFTFDTKNDDEIDGAPHNVSISMRNGGNENRANGKRKPQNISANASIFKRANHNVKNIKVTTNAQFRRVFESNKRNEEFEFLEVIGSGTYGEVHKAKCRTTNQTIAIKRLGCKLNTPNSDQSMDFITREYDHLMEVRDCPQIVHLIKWSKRQVSKNQLQVDLCFEYCPHDLKRLIANNRISFQLSEIKTFLRQMLVGLDYMHSHSIMHRDFKTENILLTLDGVVKIADFGLSRKLSDPDGLLEKERFTPNMCTQWYRAPEILLGDRQYDERVDMWSFACVMGEFWHRQAILQGENEMCQINLISKLCGSMTPQSWPNIVNLKMFQQIRDFPKNDTRKARSFLKGLAPIARDDHPNDFFDKQLQCNPSKRLSAERALNDIFFYKSPLPSPNLEKFMERSRKKLVTT